MPKVNTELIYDAMVDAIESDTDGVITQDEIIRRIYKNNVSTTDRRILSTMKSVITKTLTHGDKFIGALYHLDKDASGNVIYVKNKSKSESLLLWKRNAIRYIESMRLAERSTNLLEEKEGMLRRNRRRFVKEGRVFNEKIKATHGLSADEYGSTSSLYTIEEVIDSENLAEWVCERLNKLADSSDSNIVGWSFSVEDGSTYRRDRRSGTVQNRVVGHDPDNPNPKYSWEKYDLLISCIDGEINVYTEDKPLFKGRDSATWTYSDLTKQDAYAIADFIFDHINAPLSELAKRHDDIRDKARHGQPRNRRNKLQSVAKYISSVCDVVVEKLPRGKQRAKTDYTVDERVDTGVVSVLYRDNSSSPYNLVCKFFVIKNYKSDDEYEVVCTSASGKEVGSTVAELDGDEVEIDRRFIEKCVLASFDDRG